MAHGRVLPALVTAALVATMAQLPVLAHPRFYLTDDSAAQFLPTWYLIGERLRSGEFPLLDPTLWAGGNLAAEALFGLYNPLLLANAVVVSVLPDFIVASVLSKTLFLVLLGVGTHVLAREYGVPPWFAVVPAVTVPFAGVTLYFDAASWASALLNAAFVPWFWCALRRSARGALNPLAAFAAGYLVVTAGNPYGALAAALVVLGLVVEFGITRQWAALRRGVLGGVAVGSVVPLVYLPLVLTQPVTYRSGASIANDNLMVPGLGDLLNASTPSFAAWVEAFERPYLTVPATYIAWYAVPLLPWLRYDRVGQRLRSVAALPVCAVVALAFSTGPSDLWMFRWPLRVVPLLVLPVVVLLAVALSEGLARTHLRRRTAGSAALVLGGAWLAESARPDLVKVHIAAMLLVGALVGALVTANRWAPRHGTAAPVAVLVTGCVAVLAFQVSIFPRNQNLNDYRWPDSVAAVHDQLGPRYPGTVLQVADNGVVQHSDDAAGSSTELMFGNMLQAAGIDAVNSYYGMGLQAFTRELCMGYNGSVCVAALDRVWGPAAPGGPLLADVLRLDTVVVQNELSGVGDMPVPVGWRVAERDDRVTVLRREQPLPHPDGRLADAPAGTAVLTDIASARKETVELAGGPGGALTFARLAWPGYAADLDGTALPVRQGPAGLLVVEVPPGARGTLTLTWTPPGLTAGAVGLVLGALLVAGLTAVDRRRPNSPPPVAPGPAQRASRARRHPTLSKPGTRA